MELCLFNRMLIGAIVLSIYFSAVQAQNDEYAILPSNITGRISFPVRFDCQPSDPNGFARWALGSDFLMITNSTCSGCQQLVNGSLYISAVNQGHDGPYTCFLFNVGGGMPRFTVYLTVAEDPEIVTPANNILVNEGDTLRVNVYVTGVPQPSITWERDGQVLDSINDPRVIITGSNLSLSDAQHTDAGVYEITAQNIANTVKRSYNVIVQFIPIITITRTPDTEMVDDNVRVTVMCSVKSNPQPSINWEQIAEDVMDVTRTATTQHTMNGIFNFTSISSISFTNDNISGFSKFCCTASNSIGTAEKCLNFTETGTPSAPTGFDSTNLESTTVTVVWQSSFTTSGDNIEYKLSWSTSGVVVNSTTLQSSRTSYTIENLNPDTDYMLMIYAINAQTGQRSSSKMLNIRTLVAAPGEVLDFAVKVLGAQRIFQLTWQAPEDSQVDYYRIYVNGQGDAMVPGNTTSYNSIIHEENIVYEFAVQAVNEGGSGPISNSMAVVYCSTTPSIVVKFQRFSDAVNVMWNLTRGFDSNGIYLIVTDKNDAEFVTGPISDDKTSQCIDNLEPNMDYSITVLATFNCRNVSGVVDFTTLLATQSDSTSSIEGCIKYDPPQNIDVDEEPEEESDSGLAPWAIALIVFIPIVALVIMLCVGILFALKVRSLPKDPGGLPADNNAATYRQQQYEHQDQQQLTHLRNNSTSTYTNGSTSDYRSGSISPTRSALSYNSRPGWPYRNPSIDIVSTIDEHSTGTSV